MRSHGITADKVYIVSYPKAGRTWLRLLIALSVQDAPIEIAVEATENKRLRSDFPFLIFEHGNHLEPRKFRDFFETITEEHVVLLFRDPRDIVVSSFFQESLRNERYTSGGLDNFIRDPKFGIKSIVRYYNEAVSCINDPFIIHYEDLHSNPESVLNTLFERLGVIIPDDKIRASTVKCNFETLQKEAKSSKNFRLAPTDPSNPESQKFRRGKVEGYSDYMSSTMLEYSAKALQILHPIYAHENKRLY